MELKTTIRTTDEMTLHDVTVPSGETHWEVEAEETELVSRIGLKNLMVDSRRIAKEHGFETKWENFPEKLMLIVSELSEALEEFRANRFDIWYNKEKNGKPEGIVVELADAQIRLAELCEALNLDLEGAVRLKQDFNEGREYKHGKTC